MLPSFIVLYKEKVAIFSFLIFISTKRHYCKVSFLQNKRQRWSTITFSKYHNCEARFRAVSQKNPSRFFQYGSSVRLVKQAFKIERILGVLKILKDHHSLYFTDEEN